MDDVKELTLSGISLGSFTIGEILHQIGSAQFIEGATRLVALATGIVYLFLAIRRAIKEMRS